MNNQYTSTFDLHCLHYLERNCKLSQERTLFSQSELANNPSSLFHAGQDWLSITQHVYPYRQAGLSITQHVYPSPTNVWLKVLLVLRISTQS